MNSSLNASNMVLELPRKTMQLAADKLPPGVTLLLVAPQDLAPEFVRLPDGEERCPITGMSKTWIMERIRDSQGTAHPIRAHHVRERGRVRGTVLIHRQSLIDYVNQFPAPQWAQAATESASRQGGKGQP